MLIIPNIEQFHTASKELPILESHHGQRGSVKLTNRLHRTIKDEL